MPLVIVAYIMANVSYFLVLPFSVIDSSNTVAVKFGSKVFGPIGSLVFALIVSTSCFGTLNATTFTGARLVYSAGKEGFLPALFGRIGIGGGAEPSLSTLRTRSWVSKSLARWFGDSDTGLFFTPVNAMILNALVASCYILIGEFGTLVTFYGVAGYTFYFFTVLGLIILRVKEPHLERPYRTWILIPIIFCCVSLFLLSRAIFAQPVQAVVVMLFIVAGVPIYYWRVRGRDRISKGHDDTISWWKFWKRS
jgi:amino acid transporter